MRLKDLAGHIGVQLAEELRRLQMSFKGFPYHIHVKGCGQYHEDKFFLFWTTKAEHFGSPEGRDIVSKLYCEVVGTHDGCILLKVKAHSLKKYLGQEQETMSFSESRSWYKQDWREDYFIVEARPSVIWTLMEAHANFDKVVEEVHEG
jgi:hypothetical protein